MQCEEAVSSFRSKVMGIISDPEGFSVRMCQSVCVCNWWRGFLWRKYGGRSLTSITCDRISDGSQVSSSSNVHNCHCPAVSWLFKLWSLHIHNHPCVGLVYWGRYWAGSHERPCSHVIPLQLMFSVNIDVDMFGV